jgi:GNAT superfamily N-acetyltransferase
MPQAIFLVKSMVNIRIGEKGDLPDLLLLVKELAIYENAENEVETTLESMAADAFGGQKLFNFLVAEVENEILATAVYFYTYSTWKGKTLYLEDIVVNQQHRRKGIGTLLFNHLLFIAKNESVKRMSWQVLNWNEPAIEFYKKIDTIFDSEWINCKLTFDQLQNKR